MENYLATQENQFITITRQIFDTIDVSENTRKDYFVRIKHFLAFIEGNGLNRNSYLEYKRYLSACDTYSVSINETIKDLSGKG